MGTLLSYSGLTTKIRAMESQLITEEQLQEIVQLGSVPQVIAYLKRQPGYARLWAGLDENQTHRGELERLLVQSIHQNYTRLYHFSNTKQKRFLAMYFKRYEISIVKECLVNLFDHRNTVLDLSHFEAFFARHSKLNLQQMTTAGTLGEFIRSLEGTEYYTPLHQLYAGGGENLLVFDYGMALDQYYFSSIWKGKDKLFSGRDLKEITAAYGRKFDLINLTWIFRAKKYYHMERSRIYSLLIPMRHRLSTEELQALVEAETMDEFSRVLSGTYYAKIYRELAPENLEVAYTELMKSLLSAESTRHPHSVAVIYSYLYKKEHEVDRLTTAIECVRYGVPPDEAMAYVLKS